MTAAIADIVTRATAIASLDTGRKIAGAPIAADLLRSLPDVMETVRRKRGLTMAEAARQVGIATCTWQAVIYGARGMQIGKALVILDWIANG